MSGRLIQALKPHVPMIKFPTRINWTPKLPEASVPSIAAIKSARPVLSSDAPDTIEVFRVIPNRFRRRPVAIEELEYIQRGGPE